jgi:tetratricopeptide (TPR) repeat protein
MPTLVRYRLADKALAEYNVRLAGTLLKDMQAPPAGEDEALWRLRRARVLVYAGDDQAAVTLLRGLATERPTLDPDFADRLLQVVFDLQALGRHAEALPLLEAVYARVEHARLRRELLFWQAESQAGLKRYQDAAELFLRSATFAGASGGDPWGMTARFHAAEALAKAGLTDDARGVYNKLLAVTDDPRRRSVIERNIQQLWLIERQKSAR